MILADQLHEKLKNLQPHIKIIQEYWTSSNSQEQLNNLTKESEDPTFWQKKYTLVKQAVAWGASEIQLDYIRYSTKQKPSSQNAKDIYVIIQWYKNKLMGQNIQFLSGL